MVNNNVKLILLNLIVHLTVNNFKLLRGLESRYQDYCISVNQIISLT